MDSAPQLAGAPANRPALGSQTPPEVQRGRAWWRELCGEFRHRTGYLETADPQTDNHSTAAIVQRGMRSTTVVLAILVTSCGASCVSVTPSASPTSSFVPSSSQAPSPSPSPGGSCYPTSIAWTASPPAGAGLLSTSGAPPLFAVLEAEGTTYCASNTVVIAGLDGRSRASATFQPMPVPGQRCIGSGSWLPPSAHVAAGKVFFVDGTGTIRSLDANGKVKVLAAIPFSGVQQMLSFAINPDGSTLMAAVFTLPPLLSSGDLCDGGTWSFGPGTSTLDVYSGPSSGPVRLLYHQILWTGTYRPQFDLLAFVGWDALGLLVTDPTNWTGGGGGDALPLPGIFARVDPQSGLMTHRLENNPESCLVANVGARGDYACLTGMIPTYTLSVRRPDHSEIWAFTHLPAYAGIPYLSPSENSAAFTVPSELPQGLVVTPAGAGVSVAAQPLGWLGDKVVIGSNRTDLVYVTLSAPNTAVDLGITGVFVGTIQA
jgi:hypothetical protein